MKKNRSMLMNSLLLLLTAGLFFSSCKRKFDAPPVPGDLNIVANTTIRDLKALHTTPGAIDVLTTDRIISGVVVANDKTGNIYKELYIQDSTGGIALQLDATNLYTTYPVGRRVWVYTKGLALSDYNRQIQLGVRAVVAGVPSVQPIASGLVNQYLKGGSLNNPVAPKVVTLSQLGTSMQDPYQSTLIQLQNYEFQVADTAKTYSDTSAYKNTVNLTIRSCAANSNVIVRTSGYSSFAGVNVPNGNGNINAIYTIFGTTRQLLVRDTADVQFTGPRCGQGPTTVMDIAAVRALFTGSATMAPAGRRITGVVISDRSTSNINAQNLVLQQASGQSGILVRFDAAHSFDLGDSIDVNVSNQEISEFNGLLQVNNVPLGYATRISTGKTITPRVATLAEINTNINNWESTLVQVSNVALSGGSSGNYSGTVTMTNATGTLALFTSTGATFASSPYPANAATVTGYLTQFNTTNQLQIRRTTDVVAGTGGGGGTGTGLALNTSPFVLNFDNLAGGLPQGVFVKVGATASSMGTADAAIFGGSLATPTAWSNTSFGVKNFASATGLTATATTAEQDASTNRALGLRQTSTAGADPGSSFLFQLDNTTGKSNFQLSFLLQSLDASANGRVTTWTVEYGLGDNPTTWTAVATTPGTLTTSLGNFQSQAVSATLPAAVNNQNGKVWIRIVTLVGSTGSGSRASTAIDNFQLTWN